jgi:hypothetical protein
MILAMHGYLFLLVGLAGGLSAVGGVAGGVAMSDDYTRWPPGAGVNRRRRLASRYQAHPRAMGVQLACLGAAVVLLLAALVIWLA